MAGKHHFNVLSGAYDRKHLMDSGRGNGVDWEEHSDPEVNWMRFSTSATGHLDSGKEFHVDGSDPDTLKLLLAKYSDIRDLHKKTMIPHVRAAITKLRMESNDHSKTSEQYLSDAYEHLEANGGHHWSNKVSELNVLNTHISKLSSRLSSMGHQV